jgi:hypothetical protein
MRIIPTREPNGNWVTPIPFLVTREDLESLIKDSAELETVAAMMGARLDGICYASSLAPVIGHYSEPESLEKARVVNGWFNRLNTTIQEMRNNYFQLVASKYLKAGEQLEYDLGTGEWKVPDSVALPEPAPAPAAPEAPAVRESKGAGFRLLLSTRKLLGSLGVDFYDGPEFKFASNRHPSPAESYVPTLAKEYMMKVIIPNALLAEKHWKKIPMETAVEALDYCMRTGKSPEAVQSWEQMKNDPGKLNPVLEKYTFYVLGKRRDGRDIEADHRCYFDKYVSLKGKDAPKFKRGKNQEVVYSLLKRMESEPALKTMSHRQLMAAGITNRVARLFMEARKGK